MRFRIEHDQAAFDDFEEIDAFDRPVIHQSIRFLADQADVPTRNRRLIKQPISWCPEATWQQRVGSYRILYCLEDGTCRILRVRWKGSLTTEETGP